MKPIWFHDTLDYYDGIEIFEARDRIGGNYIGVLIGSEGDHDQFLVAGVIPESLREFRAGQLDLRSLLLEASEDEWYVTWTSGDLREPLGLTLGDGPIRTSGYIPEEGSFLYRPPEDDKPAEWARMENNLVIELRATPPEALHGHRIRTKRLGELLLHVQGVVSHSYSNALKGLPQRVRRQLDTKDGHLTDVVVPAAPGSYRIVLEAVSRPDMFGFSELERAMRRMDAVFENARDPKTARQALQAYKGHLAGSYIRLMNFLADNDTGLRYGWASPRSPDTKYSEVSPTLARSLAESLADASSLGREDVVIEGSFERVHVGAGTWGLNTGEEVQRGRLAEDGPDLSGLTVSERYIFECEEVFDLDATGRELKTLYLKNIRESA